MIKKALHFAVLVCFGLSLATANLHAIDANVVKAWIEQLRRPNVKLQIQASAKLAELGSLGILADSSLEPLANCLQNADSNVRLYASFALGRIEADKEKTIGLLIPLLLDRDEHVRYSAEWSIAEVAKSASIQEYGEQESRRLLGVFVSAENEMSRGSFQERHVLAVKLARSKLENLIRPIPEIETHVSSPPPILPTQDATALSDNSMSISMSFYEANDLVGRLQIVDRMESDPNFHDSLRLAVLKSELQKEESPVADYALARWHSTGKRLLSALYSEIKESELNTSYAMRVLRALAPTESDQLDRLFKLAQSNHLDVEIRIASLDAIARATAHADTILPTLLAIFSQSDLPAEVRTATARALVTLAPSSHEAVSIIVGFMRELPVDDALFSDYAEILGDFGPTGAFGIDLVVKGLGAEEVFTRITCASTLEKLGAWAANGASALVARIVDPEEEVAVKSQSANALKQIGQVACNLLLEHVQNPDPTVREHVLRALATAAGSNPMLIGPCLSLLADSDEVSEVRAAAATALGCAGLLARQAIPALLNACDDSQPSELRAAAIIALSQIDPEQAIVVIQTYENDAPLLVKASAAFSLHICGDTTASLEALLELLAESNSNELFLDVLKDLGPSAANSLLQVATNRNRSAEERVNCVEALISMREVAWPTIVRLLEDDDIGDQIMGLVESSELLESEVAPLLIGMLRTGKVGSSTRSRIVQIFEADGFGAAGDDDKWAGTFAINQPGTNRLADPPPKKKMSMAAKLPTPRPSPAAPPSAVPPSAVPPSAVPLSAIQSKARAAEVSPESVEEQASQPLFKKGDERRVSVFYGTNRSPLQTVEPTVPIQPVHVGMAFLAMAAMFGCFFLFPRHSNVRYAIASLVGMGAVSTIALQVMLLTNWQELSHRPLGYGGEFNDQIQYGVCEVSIPVGHKPGELEAPQMFKLEITPDPAKHIVLTNVERLPVDAFHAGLKTEMERKGKNIFVFIHGYNVSFEDAARRTAQMAFDLKFPGAPVFYSWPSQANWYSYVVDKESIESSTSQIRSFLLDIASQSNADTINLIAHSMGNVGLTAALSEIELRSKPHFNQVVLAAPDIDARVFREQIASNIIAKSRHTTLYTSKTDLALIASRYFNQRERVGDSGPDVMLVDGMDTIDATAVDSSLLGHSYYGSNVTVLDDLGRLLLNQPIESRQYLKVMERGTQPYWAFVPTRISRAPPQPLGLSR